MGQVDDDDRVLQPEPVLQPHGQLDIDKTFVANLDVNQPAVPSEVDEASDLEPAEPELVGDLHLRSPV